MKQNRDLKGAQPAPSAGEAFALREVNGRMYLGYWSHYTTILRYAVHFLDHADAERAAIATGTGIERVRYPARISHRIDEE